MGERVVSVRVGRRVRGVSLATVVAVTAATLVLGVAGPAHAVLPPAAATTGLTGVRPSATSIPFAVSDQVSASVDVATGNLLVSNTSLSLVGVTGPVTIGQSYNSLGSTIGSTSIPSATNWTVGISGVGYLAQATGKVVYTTGDGATWPFTPVAGSSTAFTSPAGFKQDLVGAGSTYLLTDRVSRQVVTFNSNGQPTTIADRNGNTTTVGYTGVNPTSILSSAGPLAGRTAALVYTAGTFTLTASQTSGALTRTVRYVKDAASNLRSIVDAVGKTTSFTYTGSGAGSKLATITSPTGGVTTFTYGVSGKVEQVAQTNTTAGSPGTSTTRLTYPSATQTLVAGPNTSLTVAVPSGPRTTYTIDPASRLVTVATDPMGRVRSAQYTVNADVSSFTAGAGGTAGTSTAQYGANNGESQTQAKAPGGATRSAAYANTAAATKYLPSSSTDDASNGSTFTYNGAGNPLTSTNALAATATLTYNPDGTIATATAPGNGTNKTVYAYNGDKQLVTVTPVTGSTLGVRTFSYDGFGRLKTATDGRGTTTTYGYDLQDRVLSTTFSTGTPTVTTTYTDAGLLKSRADANGTTQYGYDQLGRLISRVNSFAGGTIAYGYDKASNLTTTTDSRGVTTNAFDASGTPTQLTYTKGTGTQVLGFTTDNRGRRTDTYLQTNAARTVWSARTHNDYDTTGRVSRTYAQLGPATAPTMTLDVTYCYNTATPAPTCGTGTATDRSKLQWSRDNLTGQVTTYTYTTAGAISQVAQSGGTAPNSTWTYTYDSRGNRLTATTTGASTSSQSFTVNAANQITSPGYTFDGTGNMTADPAGTYTYNGAQQMTTVTQGGTAYAYTYAGATQNEVLSQEKAGSTYQLVYGREDAQGQPVVEQVKVISGTSTATAFVENDPVTGEPLLLRTSTGTVALYVYSGVGNPVGLLTDGQTSAFGYTFDPFGVPVLTSTSGGSGVGQNPFLFAGGIQDRATGWVHFGARWYNPTTGRWTQQDTLDSALDPNNANRYAYAGNDPVNNVDPGGQLTEAQQCGLAFFAIATIGTLVIAGATVATAGAATAAGATAAAATASNVGTGAGIGFGAVFGLAGIFGC